LSDAAVQDAVDPALWRALFYIDDQLHPELVIVSLGRPDG